MSLYRGPEGKARVPVHIGFAVGDTIYQSVGSIPEAIRETCTGCINIIEERCNHPASRRTGVPIGDSSPRCDKYESL